MYDVPVFIVYSMRTLSIESVLFLDQQNINYQKDGEDEGPPTHDLKPVLLRCSRMVSMTVRMPSATTIMPRMAPLSIHYSGSQPERISATLVEMHAKC